MSKISDFIKWLNEQVGSIYVWGAQGETATEALIRKMEKSETNINRVLALYRKRVADGKTNIKMYDCSGLIICYFLEHGYIATDTTAAGLYDKCKAIKQSELKAGDLVFHHNGKKIHHVGVYIGENTVIHSKGRDVGVVKEKFNIKDWNMFGRYEKLQESEETKMRAITKTSPLMRGEDIKALQTALNALGYDCGTADGIAGDKTIKAIQAFADNHTTKKLPESVTVTAVINGKEYVGDINLK